MEKVFQILSFKYFFSFKIDPNYHMNLIYYSFISYTECIVILIFQYILYLYFYVGFRNNQIKVNQNVKFHGTLNHLVKNLDLNCNFSNHPSL